MIRISTLFAVGLLFCLLSLDVHAQKKPLDHTVYDGWQTIGEKQINATGDWLAYTIDVQEGDGMLVIQKSDSSVNLNIPRGYNLVFSSDGQYLVGKIKPFYMDVRQAKIRKLKPDEMPKDSLFIFNTVSRQLEKMAGVVSFKLAAKSAAWLAYALVKKPTAVTKTTPSKDTAITKKDSGKVMIPVIIEQEPNRKQKRKLTAGEKQDGQEDFEVIEDADGDEAGAAPIQEGTTLVLKSLKGLQGQIFPLVAEYQWSENGKILLVESTASKADKSVSPAVYIWRAVENRLDTILKGGNDFRNFTVTPEGDQLAFLAERDSSFKSVQKFFKLWHWKNGNLQASVLADKFTPGMNLNWTISEHAVPQFSMSGKRLFLGTSPVKPLKDTSLVEMDLVKLDIWHYADDYLQPFQLRTLEQENRRSFMGMIDLKSGQFTQLADLSLPQVILTKEGDGSYFVGVTDLGKRIPMQWEGTTRRDVYTVDPTTGSRKSIAKDLLGMPQTSPHGEYIFWYDAKLKHYFTYRDGKTTNISGKITRKLFDEEHDMPSDPTPYGVMRWHEKDSFVYVYDRFDVWKLDPNGIVSPQNLTLGMGRKEQIRFRYQPTDPEAKFIKYGEQLLFKTFNETNKFAGFATMALCCGQQPEIIQSGPFALGTLLKGEQSNAYLYVSETFASSPNIYFSNNLRVGRQMSSINPQQSDYNWMTAELFSWKAYDGQTATGIVYKPADFKPGKKYPMIAYFYETLSDGLYSYLPPAPTPSRLNIPFFVSRGYIVLAPDIRYTKGYPGKAAFDYVVSGSRALVKKGWVDSTHMGIQGQSWGGYQVAHIITRTPLFAAAWAGAPVANMTSAYGGIRWESGMNRQFQYEKSQSRIGATLWEKPQLYIENSPLFHLPKVKTPFVIMSNDNDGAVPWYQGIEMYTAMRRLGKKVWMLNYNGEAHNLVERKNRKDIQIREQQFFDWLLKGEKPSVWLTDGVPAIEKGRTWGLETSLD
jgi:acetyl esterase/lipase